MYAWQTIGRRSQHYPLPVRLRHTQRHRNCPTADIPIVGVRTSTRMHKRVWTGIGTADGRVYLARPLEYGYSADVVCVHLDRVVPI